MKFPLWLTYRCWKNGSGLGTCTHTFHSLGGQREGKPPDLRRAALPPPQMLPYFVLEAGVSAPSKTNPSASFPPALPPPPLPALNCSAHICKLAASCARLLKAQGTVVYLASAAPLSPTPPLGPGGQRASSSGLWRTRGAPSTQHQERLSPGTQTQRPGTRCHRVRLGTGSRPAAASSALGGQSPGWTCQQQHLSLKARVQQKPQHNVTNKSKTSG